MGGILAIVGAFLPWAIVGGNSSVTGLSGQGLFVVTFSLIAIGLIFFREWEQLEQAGILSMGVLTVIVIMNVFSSIGEIPEGQSIALSTSPGIGLYISLVGGLVLVAGGGLGYMFGSKESKDTSEISVGTHQEQDISLQGDATDKIGRLNELREQGAITEEEFEIKKEELLKQV